MRYLICVFMAVCLASCKNDVSETKKKIAVKEETQAEDTIIIATIDSLGFNGKIFDFSLTRDPHFCNLDSLVEGDCNSGFFYFTPKGNVVYNYICLGNTDDFCIGKATKTAQGFDLTFNQIYTYAFSEENTDSPTVAEINSGKLEKMEAFTLHLKKLACKDAYAFTGGVNVPEYYIVTELKNPREQRLNRDFLLRNYNRAKVLRQF